MTDVVTLLSELDALAEKATPGRPWIKHGYGTPTDERWPDVGYSAFVAGTELEVVAECVHVESAAYIAALANAYPLLRTEILRLREALEPFARAEAVGGSVYHPNRNEYSLLFRDEQRLESADFRRARAALKG